MTEFDGFDELGEELQDLGDEVRALVALLDGAIDRGVETTALQVEATARRKVPVDTGTLRASIRHQQVASGRWTVGTNVEYAEVVEKGTSPHVITPDGAQALRFTQGGDVVFATTANHPGTPAQPYLRPALVDHRSDLVENIQEQIDDLVDEVMR